MPRIPQNMPPTPMTPPSGRPEKKQNAMKEHFTLPTNPTQVREDKDTHQVFLQRMMPTLSRTEAPLNMHVIRGMIAAQLLHKGPEHMDEAKDEITQEVDALTEKIMQEKAKDYRNPLVPLTEVEQRVRKHLEDNAETYRQRLSKGFNNILNVIKDQRHGRV